MMETLTRRGLIAGLAAGLANRGTASAAAAGKGITVCAFSKHFQWADVPEAAQTIASLGYDAVDLTVREGGHVSPARVQEDLPKAVEAIKRAGLKIPMVTGDIRNTKSPYAESVIQTLAALDIRRYRWGGFRYDEKRSIPDQLTEFKAQVKDLAAMNKHYGVCAMYHTHSGIGQVGASMWDLYLLLKDFDTDSVAVNYDIGHAVVEGGLGGWIHSARLLLPYMRGTAVKDFKWVQDGKGAWEVGWCGLGQGMVDVKRYLSMLKAGGFSGPLQLHMEYDELGGADAGRRQITIPKQKLLAIMRRDMDVLKPMLREAGLA
jgi:sugar phosphate isomerase/epimerase